jgi:flagellar biosynthesis protein FliQ
MKTIKSVSAKSLAKLLGAMYAIIGLVFGLVVSLLALVSQAEDAGALGIMLSAGAVIVFPLMYGLMGWIGGYICGWLYNLLAKRIGGIRVEV